MNKTELYKLLDLDSPADFDYFEQFADLLECDEEIDYDLFYEVLSKISAESAGDITENYFEEISRNLPDNGEDLFSIIDMIEDRLLLLAQTMDESSKDRSSFINELFRFREWYTNPTGALVDDEYCAIRDAVTMSREEKLGGPVHSYNFSESTGYQLEELSYSIGNYNRIDIVEPEESEE